MIVVGDMGKNERKKGNLHLPAISTDCYKLVIIYYIVHSFQRDHFLPCNKTTLATVTATNAEFQIFIKFDLFTSLPVIFFPALSVFVVFFIIQIIINLQCLLL